jgi:hypothetical protein
MDLLKLLSLKLEIEEFIEVLTIARLIWLRRNEVVFHDGFFAPISLVVKAVQIVEEFNKANSYPPSRPILKENTDMSWQRPPLGMIKVNWDIAIDRECQQMGIGVVIRDDTELCIAAMAMVIPHVLEPTTAEGLGAWRAVLLCWDLGLSNFVLEGDSKTLVSGINEATQYLSRFGHIIDSIRDQLKSFHHAKVCYTDRNANKAADVLAKFSI